MSPTRIFVGLITAESPVQAQGLAYYRHSIHLKASDKYFQMADGVQVKQERKETEVRRAWRFPPAVAQSVDCLSLICSKCCELETTCPPALCPPRFPALGPVPGCPQQALCNTLTGAQRPPSSKSKFTSQLPTGACACPSAFLRCVKDFKRTPSPRHLQFICLTVCPSGLSKGTACDSRDFALVLRHRQHSLEPSGHSINTC